MADIKHGRGKGLKDKTFFYTQPEMVKDLLNLIPFKEGDKVLDAGSGKNKVWFNNLPECVKKYECEIDDGCNFLNWDIPVDWVVGNPPFHLGNEFIQHSASICKVGFAFLLSIRSFNSLTPNRLEQLKQKGFYLSKIHIVNDKRWYGRYYFVIFTRDKNLFLTWKLKTY